MWLEMDISGLSLIPIIYAMDTMERGERTRTVGFLTWLAIEGVIVIGFLILAAQRADIVAIHALNVAMGWNAI